jgi:hypothetical protein
MLLGFAQNVQGQHEITSVAELVTEERVSAFVGWLLSERGVRGNSVIGRLRLLYAAVRHYPKYKRVQLTFQWFESLIEAIPEDCEEEAFARKEKKYLPYETLVKIPELIRAGRLSELRDKRATLTPHWYKTSGNPMESCCIRRCLTFPNHLLSRRGAYPISANLSDFSKVQSGALGVLRQRRGRRIERKQGL